MNRNVDELQNWKEGEIWYELTPCVGSFQLETHILRSLLLLLLYRL